MKPIWISVIKNAPENGSENVAGGETVYCPAQKTNCSLSCFISRFILFRKCWVMGDVKVFRIVHDTFRNFREGFDDLALETACGLHNWRLNFRLTA
jgi:hypothetical protein